MASKSKSYTSTCVLVNLQHGTAANTWRLDPMLRCDGDDNFVIGGLILGRITAVVRKSQEWSASPNNSRGMMIAPSPTCCIS